MKRRRVLLAALLVADAVALAGVPRPSAPRAAAAAAPTYVDDRACAPCHAAEARAWAGSHHDRAMQRADASTVLGAFDGARFTRFGVTARFFRRDGRFFVATEGPDGRAGEFEVAYTFGVAPLQQYLVPFPGGRLQALTIAWDTVRRRWFSLYPRARIRADDALHWTGRYQNWNLMCAECHSTNLKKGYDPDTDAYRTTWDALNVGCQACHGPGSAHVAWGERGAPADASGDGLLVDLRRARARDAVDACARCHARRARLAPDERFGRPLLDEFRLDLLRAPLYYPDGQQRDEVYEYGSFVQTRMAARGVRCTDCHDPHGGKLRATGDRACTRCHGPRPDARFPSLAPQAYDTPAHHFHRPGSPGARCVACHMPARVYMGVDARRDHSFPVPRPDLSASLGTPDACTACHRGRSLRWAAAAIERRHGTPPATPHWGEAVAAGRAGAAEAGPRLVALARDTDQPAIVRATALEVLRAYGADGLAAMVAATRDAEPLVRAAAVAGLAPLPPAARVAAAGPLLDDPLRSVRIEAARVLAGVPRDLLDEARRHALDVALAEFRTAELAMADMPAGRLNLGALAATLGDAAEAEREYRVALRMDADFYPARTNLVGLLSARGQNDEAERLLREGLARTPGQGELHYALGLLLVEARRVAEGADELGAAARLLPGRARVRYNQGLALQQLGRGAEAERTLLRARALAPRDPEIAYALAALYVRNEDYRRALVEARALAALVPGDPRAAALVHQIERALDTGATPAGTRP